MPVVARVSAKTPTNQKRAFTLSSELQYGAATFQNLRRRVGKSEAILYKATASDNARQMRSGLSRFEECLRYCNHQHLSGQNTANCIALASLTVSTLLREVISIVGLSVGHL